MGGELHPCFKVFPFIIIIDGVVFKRLNLSNFLQLTHLRG